MTFLPAQADRSAQNRYRSWGETQISRLLDRHGIRYSYEHPVAVVDQGKTRIWYPDFQLEGYGILIEYCGKPHDPDYAAGMVRKQTVYQANGLTALMLTPEVFQGNWPVRILDQVGGVLADRLATFRAVRHRQACGGGAGGADFCDHSGLAYHWE